MLAETVGAAEGPEPGVVLLLDLVVVQARTLDVIAIRINERRLSLNIETSVRVKSLVMLCLCRPGWQESHKPSVPRSSEGEMDCDR
jgi:hypothetical protein